MGNTCCFEGLKRKKVWLEQLEHEEYLPEIDPYEESASFRFWASSLGQGNFQLRVWTTLVFVALWLFVHQKTSMLAKIEFYVFWVLGIGLSLLLSFKLRVALKRYWEARTAMANCLSEIRSNTATLLAAYECDPNKGPETWAVVDDCLTKIEGFFWSVVFCLKDRELTTVPDKWVNDPAIKEVLSKAKPSQWMLIYAQQLKGNLLQLRKMNIVTPPLYANLNRDVDKQVQHFYTAFKIATTPFPYPYNQLMFSLSHLFCYMVSLVITVAFSYVGGLFAVFISFIFLGLDHVAGELMDPFGDDIVDLAIIKLADGLHHDMKNFRHCMTAISDVGEEEESPALVVNDDDLDDDEEESDSGSED